MTERTRTLFRSLGIVLWVFALGHGVMAVGRLAAGENMAHYAAMPLVEFVAGLLCFREAAR